MIWFTKSEPAYVFELSGPVVDAAWAPYTSTVFAAITIDGYIYFYNIFVDDIDPLCVQKITYKKKNTHKLTHLAFNPAEPILLVTDDK